MKNMNTSKLRFNDLNRKMRKIFLKDLKKKGYYVSDICNQSSDEYVEFIESISEKLKERYSIDKLVEKDYVITSCSKRKLFINQNTVLTSFVSDTFSVSFTPYGDGVQLYVIQIIKNYRNNKLGQSLMDLIKSVSDDIDVPVYLIPHDVLDDDIDYERLVRFYLRNNYFKLEGSPYYMYEPVFIDEVEEMGSSLFNLNQLNEEITTYSEVG
jgi:hypothetical protein